MVWQDVSENIRGREVQGIKGGIKGDPDLDVHHAH